MKRLACCFLSSMIVLLFAPMAAHSQTITYRLHAETNNGCPRALLIANPDAAGTFTQSANLQNSTASPVASEHFCATAIPGTIPANSTVTLNIYIQKTANFGTIYP